MGRFLLPVVLPALFFIISGCIGGKEIKADYDPAGGVPEGYSLKSPLNIAVIPYEDKRTGIESKKKVADISATVEGVHSAELLLDEDVSDFVTKAVRTQLNAAGFKAVIASGPSSSDIVISGEIKRFNLKVTGRDKIEIELLTNIKNSKDGRLIWSGTTIEEADRYAGTMGNTKKSIAKYINKSLNANIRKILKDSEQALARHLNRGAAAYTGASPAGVPFSQPQSPVMQREGETSAGALKVTSKPAGARFYIGDTYYGKTPMTIELNAGVYEITVKLKGFKDEKEKVAVRPGTTTELDVAFGD